MSFRKITKNIYERSWKRKDGTIAKTLYFWLMIDGKVVHQRAVNLRSRNLRKLLGGSS